MYGVQVGRHGGNPEAKAGGGCKPGEPWVLSPAEPSPLDASSRHLSWEDVMANPRKLKKSDLEGKTVKTADVTAINCMTLTFTDGSSLTIEVENVGYGLSGLLTYDA
jgi:hypothetical protein